MKYFQTQSNMCCACGYKSIPYMLGLISIIEMILGIVRIAIFFGDKPKTPVDLFSSQPFPSNGTIPSPFLSSKQSMAAFALDWIASIMPTFMGIYVALFSLLALCTPCMACSCMADSKNRTKEDVEACSTCCKLMCLMCNSKANHRCVSLT